MSGKKSRKKIAKQPMSPGETTSFIEEGTRIVSAVYRMHDAEAFRKPLKTGHSMYKEYTSINTDPIFLGQIYRKLQEKPCPYRSFEDVNSDLERLWAQEERFYQHSNGDKKKGTPNSSTPGQKRYRQLQAVKNYYEVMAKPILSGHVELTGIDEVSDSKDKNKEGSAKNEDSPMKSALESGSSGDVGASPTSPTQSGSGKKKKKKKKSILRDSDESTSAAAVVTAPASEDTKEVPSKGLSRRKTDLTDVVDLTMDEDENTVTLTMDMSAVRKKYKPLRLKAVGGGDKSGKGEDTSSKTVEKTESPSMPTQSPTDDTTDDVMMGDDDDATDKKKSSSPQRKSVSFESPPKSSQQSKPSPVKSPLSAMKKMATKRTLKFLTEDEPTPAAAAPADEAEDTKVEPAAKRRRTVFRLSVWKREETGKEEMKQLYRTGYNMNDAVRSLMKEQDDAKSKLRLERVERLRL